MEEKKFAIYSFFARWNQDNYENNGSSFYKMYKEETTTEQLENDLQNYKQNIIDKQNKENHPVTEWLEIKYKYIEHESWVLYWFNHMTYNQFETDFEVEESFSNFIYRKKTLNRANGHGETEQYDYENKKPFYCFMGADDKWRWEICRCEHCVAQGKITIDH
jgi:hypothetical protein